MRATQQTAARAAAEHPEDDLLHRAQARQPEAVRAIIGQYNQRLYRLARAIVRNDADAEDVLQEAWLHAFAALGDFRGDSSLSTWLSRITINEALGRLRSQKRRGRMQAELAASQQASIIDFPASVSMDNPERTMADRELLQIVERASDKLPEPYRIVFIARVVEGLSVEETAEALCLCPATVKTRLHRARLLLRRELETRIDPLLASAFPFAGKRCERLTENVLARLREPD